MMPIFHSPHSVCWVLQTSGQVVYTHGASVAKQC